jgi:mitochondrial chaperone BCS1
VIEPVDDASFHLGNGYHATLQTTDHDTENGIVVQEIELYSYDKPYSELEKFAHSLERHYVQRQAQKVNNDTYIFNDVAVHACHTTSTFPFHTRYLFSKLPLTTTCSFINIYNEHIKRIVNRIDKFMKGHEWYRSKGVPYTLGIMFCGPSGCGKTSLVKALARYTSRHMVNVRLTDCTTVTQLRELLSNEQLYCLDDNGVVQPYTVPMDKRLIIFEDIDTLPPVVRVPSSQDAGGTTRGRSSSVTTPTPRNRTYQADLDTYMVDPYGFSHVASPDEVATIQKQRLSSSFPSVSPPFDTHDRLTLPALLNIIDGFVETSGRIIVMTATNLDGLDNALVRPRRIDMVIKLDRCSVRDVYEFVCDSTGLCIDYKRFAMIPDRYWTPAEVSQCVLTNHNDIDLILEQLSVKNPQDSPNNQRNWVYHH